MEQRKIEGFVPKNADRFFGPIGKSSVIPIQECLNPLEERMAKHSPCTLIIGGKGCTESDVNDRDAKTRAVVQALCDALKVERDAWHELHDGNCETLRSDEALARAEAELNITPQSE